MHSKGFNFPVQTSFFRLLHWLSDLVDTHFSSLEIQSRRHDSNAGISAHYDDAMVDRSVWRERQGVGEGRRDSRIGCCDTLSRPGKQNSGSQATQGDTLSQYQACM